MEFLVKEDPHLSELYQAFTTIQHGFVQQYNQEKEKIAAQMQDWERRFFHPRPSQPGKPRSGDRAVLHNQVLRYAATLSEQFFDQPPALPSNKKWEHLQKANPQRPEGATAKEKTPMERMSLELYQALRKNLKQEDKQPLKNQMQQLYQQIRADSYATQYAYTPLDAKVEIRKLLSDISAVSPAFEQALRLYLQEQHSKNPDVSLEDFKQKLLDPGWSGDRRLHDSIVRFVKKLEEQEAVINHNSDVFVHLTGAFHDPALFTKLEGLGKRLTSIPSENINYKAMDSSCQESVNALLKEVLAKAEIELKDEVLAALLCPDDLTPVTFQNTILKFSKKLEQHQAVNEHNHEVYRALSAVNPNDAPVTASELEQLHTELLALEEQAKEKALQEETEPPKTAELISYYKLAPETRSLANRILNPLFQHVNISDQLKDEFLNPDALTPMGFQNSVLRYAARLPENQAVSRCSSDIFFSLLDSLEDDTQPVAKDLAKLSGVLAALPIDQLRYHKLEPDVQHQVNHVLTEILNSKEEMDIPADIKQALLHPDELTPTGLQNQIIRFAARLEEQKMCQALRKDVYCTLIKSIDRKNNPIHKQVQTLHQALRTSPDASYHDLPQQLKDQITDMLISICKDLPVAERNPILYQKLLNPDELTPTGLQNTILRFAQKYPDYKKQNFMYKVRYAALLLARSAAWELAQINQEDAAMWYVPRNLIGENPHLKERRIEAEKHNYTAYTSDI